MPRQVYESGLVLGLVYILLRVLMAAKLMMKSIGQGLKKNSGAYFFLPCIAFFLVFGQWGNSIILGFTTLTVGVLLKLLATDE